jgi:hypothetical protein
MWKAILFTVLVICQFQWGLARAIPGTHLSGRDYADQHPSQPVKERSIVPRSGHKISPKVIIISMVFPASDGLN